MNVTKRVVLISVVAQLVLFTLFAAIAVHLYYKEERTRLERRADYLIEAAAVMSSEPVWNFDHAVLERITQAFCQESALAGCLVVQGGLAARNAPPITIGYLDSHGAIAGRARLADLVPPSSPYYDFLTRHKPVLWNGEEIAHVYLYFKGDQLIQDLVNRTLELVVIFLAMLLSSLLVTWLVLSQFFGKPFLRLHSVVTAASNRLRNFQQRIEKNGTADVKTLPDRHSLFKAADIHPGRMDEFGYFTHTFGALLTNYSGLAAMLSTKTEALSRLNDELEARVQERTQELQESTEALQASLTSLRTAQSTLVQQEKLASIGQLAAGIAHEINNPIGFIASNLNRLKEYLASYEKIIVAMADEIGKLPESDRAALMERFESVKEEADFEFIRDDFPELIGDCLEGSERVRDIVQNLKDFSHSEASGKHAPIGLHQVLRNTVKLVWNELKYDCDLTFEETPMADIRGNYGELCQVASNLLVNSAYAIRATGQHGKIEVTLLETPTHTGFSIQDNGCGMDEVAQQKVYDPFFTTKPVGEGTGLGMNIVYDIVVNKHGGAIELESKVDEGTRFTLWFPKAQNTGQGESTPGANEEIAGEALTSSPADGQEEGARHDG